MCLVFDHRVKACAFPVSLLRRTAPYPHHHWVSPSVPSRGFERDLRRGGPPDLGAAMAWVITDPLERKWCYYYPP
jgi:hypothetical protein